MRPDAAILPLVWNWYVGFFVSMGMVGAAAVSFALGLLFVDWAYLRGQQIEVQPTPRSYWGALWNLSRFRALALGLLLAPVVVGMSYSTLANVIWRIAPSTVNGPEPDAAMSALFENSSTMASIVLIAGLLAILIACGIFSLLHSRARHVAADSESLRLADRFVKRYFRDNVLVGGLLTLITIPVIAYFLYNVALLLLVLVPAARSGMSRLVLPNADALYFRFVEVLGSLLVVVLFIPAVWLLARGELLRWRYIAENAAMRLIFMRSVKALLLAFLGLAGYAAMGAWAQLSFKFIAALVVR